MKLKKLVKVVLTAPLQTTAALITSSCNRSSFENNVIYVGTDKGLNVGKSNSTNGYNFVSYTEQDGLADPNVISIYGSSNGNVLFAGTKKGLSILKRNSNNKYDITSNSEGLKNNPVYDIYSTLNGKKVYLANNIVSVGEDNKSSYVFQNYSTGLKPDSVQSIFASANSKILYVGNHGLSQGVSIGTKVDNKYIFKKDYTEPFLNVNVNDVYTSASGNLFVSTNKGLMIGSTKAGSDTYTFKDYYALFNDRPIKSLCVLADGNTIFVGINGLGFGVITKQNDGDYTLTHLYDKSNGDLGSNEIPVVDALDNGSKVYVATTNGLSVGVKQKNNTYLFTNYKKGLLSSNVLSIFATVNSNVVLTNSSSYLSNVINQKITYYRYK